MTVADAKREAETYSSRQPRQQTRAYYAGATARKEVVPDWFREQQKQRDAKEAARPSTLPVDPLKTREELQSMLDAFRQVPVVGGN
ncbi:hypothetical protein JNUCC1_00956 [Lentibacillus sp. JNUCC-1]|uniref:hypothetical protein n=1 Tax=Lentibacillus sp. JNUCC-1 TaxID=2654513 RepID=UPI0012E7E516|nr:hypothetical protein [Lentibacillus sp. JNUCC-1]MUV37150.1 hypothetical protein [Lentibacillus sp. JNUCC-1]